MDAIELLKRDHRDVTALFQRFASGGRGRGRREVVEKICNELDVHAQIEEQVFYPAVSETGDDELGRQVEEGLQEHQHVKDQVTALRRLGSDDDGQLEGMVSKLEQDVEHHVTEEEGEMFPRLAEVMNEDERDEIGERLASLKRELKGESGTAGAARRKAEPRGGRTTREGRGRATRPRKTASGGRRKTGGSARGRRSRTSTKPRSTRGKTTRRRSRSGKKQVRGGRGR